MLTATVTHLGGTRAVTVHLSQAPASAGTEPTTVAVTDPANGPVYARYYASGNKQAH